VIRGGGTLVARRAAFAGYALVIATLTHWPALTVEGPTARPDLLVHMGVFALWTLLALGAEPIGPWYEGRTIAGVMLGAAGYAALDEGSQRFVGRVSSWEDLAANLMGVALGGVIATGVVVATGRPNPRRAKDEGTPDRVRADRAGRARRRYR